jgi:glycerophosphoryl diester phosphodiesterase
VRIYGHRGASATHPENTVAAVVAAFDAGAYGVEVDARLRPDGVLVCSHDPEFGPDVATIAEILASARGRVVVEVKNIPGQPDYDGREERAAHALVALLRGTAYDVTVSSFDWFAIDVARDAGLRTAFLAPAGIALEAALAYVADAKHAELHAHWSSVLEAPADMAKAHDAGIDVVCWTVDDISVAKALRDSGVDGLMTNDPAALLAALDDD